MAKPRPDTNSGTPNNAAQIGTQLRESRERFVALWGQMGAHWGIPRTMAEVHATLFIAGRPMNTDEIIDFLEISRGNASMTLRKLIDWGIVQRVHLRGDRKEYFQAEQDVWKLFRTILRERKKREVDPVLEELRQCRALTDGLAPRNSDDQQQLLGHNNRLNSMLTFLEMVADISAGLTNDAGAELQRAASTLSSATTEQAS